MKLRIALLGSACGCMLSLVAHAESPPQDNSSDSAAQNGIETVIVTANKREERVQDVPMSVSVVGADQLAAQAIHSTDDLVGALPTLNNNSSPGGGFVIRGVGTMAYSKSAESSVGLVVDGVNLGNSVSPAGATALFDLARVELLPGPQGTLFGRGASAGVLNIVSNAPNPDSFEAAMHAEATTRDSQVYQGVLNVPLDDAAAVRLLAYSSKGPEVADNLFNHQGDSMSAVGGRLRALWQPVSDLTLNFIADFDQSKSNNAGLLYIAINPNGAIGKSLAACGVTVSPDNTDECFDGESGSYFKTYGVSFQADYALGDYLLTSITAARGQKGHGALDIDGSPLNLISHNVNTFDVGNFSQEVRLTSPSGDRFSYVVGLFYANDQRTVDWIATGYVFPGNPFLLGSTAHYQVSNQSYALFSQGTYRITDTLRLTGGLRLDHEQVSEFSTAPGKPPGAIIPLVSYLPINETTSDTDLSYRAGVQYDVVPDTMLYATYTRGYKGPAFNELPTTPTAQIIVKPEIPKQIEVGVKASLFDDAWGANLAFFDTTVDDFQVITYNPATNLSAFSNVNYLKSRGLEASFGGTLFDGFTLNGGATYVDAYYGPSYYTPCGPTQGAQQGCNPATKLQSAEGRPAIYTPRWKAVLSGQYERAISADAMGFVRADATYTSSQHGTANYDPFAVIASSFVFGASVGVESSDGRYRLSIFGRNLTDERLPYAQDIRPLFDPTGIYQALSSGSFRRVGVSLDVKF